MIGKERMLKDLKKLDSLFRSLHKKATSPEEQLAIVKVTAGGVYGLALVQKIGPNYYLELKNYFFLKNLK